MSTAEVEVQARNMGWLPKEQFRGDEGKWVDAETFVERGQTFVPYLKANNRKLESKVETLSQQLAELSRTSQEQIEALRTYNSEFNKERVERQRKNLVAGIKEARDKGDVEGEEDLREQLADTKKALEESDAAKPKPNGEAPKPIIPTVEVQQAFEGFRAQHTWYDEDHMMKAAFIGTMQTSMLNPEFAKLAIPERFAEVARQVEERFGMGARERKPSKYEGGGGGGGPDSRTDTTKKGYNELPTEAKAGCERYAAKLVGKGKAYKSPEEWQKKFAEDYWRNNPNG